MSTDAIGEGANRSRSYGLHRGDWWWLAWRLGFWFGRGRFVSGAGAPGELGAASPVYGSMRLTVPTLSIVRSKDITASTPVASAIAIRYASAKSRRSTS